MMRTFRRYAASLAAMVLMVLTFGAAAQEIPLVTGEHWMRSSEEVKKAYLVGMANIALVEITYEGPNPLPDSQTVLPRIQRGLKGHTLDGARGLEQVVRGAPRSIAAAGDRNDLVRDGRARPQEIVEEAMKRIAIAAMVAALAVAIGCTNMTPQQQGTVSGAAIGAAAGAGIAAISGGSGWTGAAIGAVAGGVAGNIKGSRQQ